MANRWRDWRLTPLVLVRAPPSFEVYELDWVVSDGSLVAKGAVLGWLRPGAHCALLALTAPGGGTLSRRSSLLTGR